jgi:hypothetical protein
MKSKPRNTNKTNKEKFVMTVSKIGLYRETSNDGNMSCPETGTKLGLFENFIMLGIMIL